MLIEERRRLIPIKKEGKVRIIIKLSLPFAKPETEKKSDVAAAEEINAFYAEIEEKYIEILKAKEVNGAPLVVCIRFESRFHDNRISITRSTEIRGERKQLFISNDIFDASLGYLLPQFRKAPKILKFKPLPHRRVKKTGS